MTTATGTLPSLEDQAERLIGLGIHELAGLAAAEVRAQAARADSGLLLVHPQRLPPSALVSAVQVDGRAAFVVSDMDDVDAFAPTPEAQPPESALYVAHGLDRGDAMRNWSPDEALPDITAAGRTPLTLTEGLHWLVQQPTVLERNCCFMTIGSRLPKPGGRLDARTPAIWISNGTGRDGAPRRNAPKVGWCWAGNRHTWLGFATAGSRSPL